MSTNAQLLLDFRYNANPSSDRNFVEQINTSCDSAKDPNNTMLSQPELYCHKTYYGCDDALRKHFAEVTNQCCFVETEVNVIVNSLPNCGGID